MQGIRPAGNLDVELQGHRMRGGVIALTVALALAVLLLKLHVAAPLRLLLFFPFLAAGIGIGQGLHNTCGFMASQGLRDVGDGPEKIVNREELATVKCLGRRMLATAFGAAAIATLAFVLLP